MYLARFLSFFRSFRSIVRHVVCFFLLLLLRYNFLFFLLNKNHFLYTFFALFSVFIISLFYIHGDILFLSCSLLLLLFCSFAVFCFQFFFVAGLFSVHHQLYCCCFMVSFSFCARFDFSVWFFFWIITSHIVLIVWLLLTTKKNLTSAYLNVEWQLDLLMISLRSQFAFFSSPQSLFTYWIIHTQLHETHLVSPSIIRMNVSTNTHISLFSISSHCIVVVIFMGLKCKWTNFFCFVWLIISV